MVTIRLAVFFILIGLFSYSANASASELNIAIVAPASYEQTKKAWQPTIDYLNTSIPEHHFNFFPIEPADFSELEFMVENKKVNFVITQPLIYIDLERLYGANAILTLVDKSKQSSFGTVLIVRADNKSIRTLLDVENRSVAAVAKKGFGGWLMAYNLFFESGIDLYESAESINFLGNQTKIVESIVSHKYDLGIVRTGMLEKLVANGSVGVNDLRVINQQYHKDFPYLVSSQLYPEWALAKTKNTSREVAKKIASVLLSIPPGDKIALRGGYWEWTTPIDYNSVREVMKKLNIGSYSKHGKVTTINYIAQHKIEVAIILVLILGLLICLYIYIQVNNKLSIEQAGKNDAIRRLEELATHDELTGLPNRYLLMELLFKYVSGASRHKKMMALMFIDLDGFKAFNDIFGHASGDNFLVSVAAVLNDDLRQSDICARFGGDEFIIVLKDFSSHDVVHTLAKRFIDDISNITIQKTRSIDVSASIGVIVTVPDNMTTPSSLIKMADELMYEAKSLGKGMYILKNIG